MNFSWFVCTCANRKMRAESSQDKATYASMNELNDSARHSSEWLAPILRDIARNRKEWHAEKNAQSNININYTKCKNKYK